MIATLIYCGVCAIILAWSLISGWEHDLKTIAALTVAWILFVGYIWIKGKTYAKRQDNQADKSAD